MKNYDKPTITDHGTVATITAGQRTGTTRDKTFPAGTDPSHFTFS